ncbi:MAG: thermonuclease family protein [Solirubrobacterales bacterium]
MVERVVDGDTIYVLLDGESVSVRYIGIDTPESGWPEPDPECFSREATDLNRRLVGRREVRLVVGQEPYDPYDRLLAYVYSGGQMVNAELLRSGAAETLTIPPNDRFAGRFSELEGQARADGRGLWGAC